MQSNQGQGRRKGSSKQKDSRPSVKEKGLEETSGFLGVSYVKMTQKKKKKNTASEGGQSQKTWTVWEVHTTAAATHRDIFWA